MGYVTSKHSQKLKVQARFVRAVRQEGTDAENEVAWRDFSNLVARAFSSGRLWQPVFVHYLTPLLFVAVAEADESDRVKSAFDAAGNDEIAAKRIASPFAGEPSLEVCDALADALEVPRGECRRRAGYFD